jgi:hypothetical protein
MSAQNLGFSCKAAPRWVGYAVLRLSVREHEGAEDRGEEIPENRNIERPTSNTERPTGER